MSNQNTPVNTVEKEREERYVLEKFRLLREELRFEYNINALRVSWYLTSQSFLVLAITSAANATAANFQWKWLFFRSVNTLGLVLSVLVLLSIYASYKRIDSIHASIGNSFNYNGGNKLRPGFFPKTTRFTFNLASRFYGGFIALSMIIFWVLILAFECSHAR